MIDFYTYNTINGKAIAIALEELEISYQLKTVNLSQGEQRKPELLALNPSGRIPVIVDYATEKPLVVSQTGAILIYLAEKTGQLLPVEIELRAKVLEFLLFQLTDITTNVFNNFYLKSLVSPKQRAAGNMLKQRALSFYEIFDQALAKHQFLASDEISIADIACFPVVDLLKDDESIQTMEHLKRWFQMMKNRAAVGLAIKKLNI